MCLILTLSNFSCASISFIWLMVFMITALWALWKVFFQARTSMVDWVNNLGTKYKWRNTLRIKHLPSKAILIVLLSIINNTAWVSIRFYPFQLSGLVDHIIYLPLFVEYFIFHMADPNYRWNGTPEMPSCWLSYTCSLFLTEKKSLNMPIDSLHHKILYFTTHLTHLLQPLDVGVFKPLKAKWYLTVADFTWRECCALTKRDLLLL